MNQYYTSGRNDRGRVDVQFKPESRQRILKCQVHHEPSNDE